jgi:radical SAM superfamily enzyme YgiQ (UPF0313 family)
MEYRHGDCVQAVCGFCQQPYVSMLTGEMSPERTQEAIDRVTAKLYSHMREAHPEYVVEDDDEV